jgi:hypothetical protein
MIETTIRDGCFQPYGEKWLQPTADEVREILQLAELTGSRAGLLLGVNGRQIRRWTGEDSQIPYAAWAILCDVAGFERIWTLAAKKSV